MTGRILAIGDIHGCDVALNALLDQFHPTAEDTVVVLGDIVDRGPGTRQVIETLMNLSRTGRLIGILGNHEQMFLEAYHGGDVFATWLGFGGQAVLDSYGGNFDSIPPDHIEFLLSFCNYWKTTSEIFVHANLEPGVRLKEQTIQWLRWRKLTGSEPPRSSGKRVICGHTPQKTGRPLVRDGWVCIDTAACRGLLLTGLDVTTNLIYQSDPAGRLRDVQTLDELAAHHD